MRDVNSDDCNNQNENRCFECRLWALTIYCSPYCGRISHYGRIPRRQASLKTLLCAVSARTLSQLCLKSLVMVFDLSWSWTGGSYSLTEFYYTGLCDRSLLLPPRPFEKRFVSLKKCKRTFYSKVISNSKWYFTRPITAGRKSTREVENEPERTKDGYKYRKIKMDQRTTNSKIELIQITVKPLLTSASITRTPVYKYISLSPSETRIN